MDFQKQNFQNIFEDNIENYYDYFHLKSVMGAQTVETNEVFPITNALCVKTKENNNEYHFVLCNSKSFFRERRNNDWLLLIKKTLMFFFEKSDSPPVQDAVQGNGILLRWIGTDNA